MGRAPAGIGLRATVPRAATEDPAEIVADMPAEIEAEIEVETGAGARTAAKVDVRPWAAVIFKSKSNSKSSSPTACIWIIRRT